MTPARTSLMAAGLALTLVVQPDAPATICPRCGWKPRAGPVVEVRNVDEFHRAVDRAQPGDTILLADGRYALRRTVDVAAANVTIRGRSGDPSKVILHGRGMTGDNVGVGISVSASGVTVADLTIRDVGFHGVQVRGERGASGFTLHNARLQDAGQQLLKGSVSEARVYSNDGLVACSEFSYSTHAPSAYTDGVDLISTRGWVIRDNRFLRIRGPENRRWAAGPAILVWGAAEDTLVERNTIIDSFRGIALGLGAGLTHLARNGERGYDHLGGIIRNNVVVNLNPWADEAIEGNAARGIRIEHNSVLVETALVDWSIAIRFPSGEGTISNNLTNQRILLRDGGQATLAGNVSTARRSWFIDAPNGDLHLAAGATPAIDVGVPIQDILEDFDRAPRVSGRAPDAGAFELRHGPAIRPRSNR